MEIITFFSFKGGVGRTQSLLNTACEFAQRGKNVVLIDFDLHAPGLSLMECMKPKDETAAEPRPGALDFFEWLVLLDEAVRRGEPSPEPINLAACAYEPVVTQRFQEGAGFFKLVPAACLSTDCSEATGYSDRVHAVDSPLTEIIRRTHRNRERNPVIEQIRSQFSNLPEAEQPDAVFIDARTGITGIADLLLTRSSDRIVLVTGLNQQNLWGLQSTLRDIERSVETPDWLRRITIVISPVPLDELELTEKRTKAIAETLNQHVDPREREMFGEVGLLPDPIEIPYNAQLALLEDPILLRHRNSIPAARFRELADRLGGKVEPLQFKESTLESSAQRKNDDGLPQEHPLARVLPWDAGLPPDARAEVLKSLGPDSQPDKPYPGWLGHVLNYLANSLSLANSSSKTRQSLILSLTRSTVAQRVSLLRRYREERQRLFAAPKAAWTQFADSLGDWRVTWLLELPVSPNRRQIDWSGLTSDVTSASLWGNYWTGMAEALRMHSVREEAVNIIATGSLKFSGRADFVIGALQILIRMYAWKEAIFLADETVKTEQVSQRVSGAALRLKGQALNMLDRVDEGIEATSSAAKIYREINHRLGEATTLRSLGDLLVRTDKLQEARALYDEALPIFREVKKRLGEANTLQSLGDLLVRTDKLEEARARYDEALPIYREVKKRLGEANTLQSLGDLLVRTDKLEEARARYDEALPICREVKDRLGEANTLKALGDLLVRTDKLDEARASYDEALAIYREVKERLGEANTLQGLGKWHLARREFEECQQQVDECLRRYTDLSDSEGRWETLLLSSRLLHAKGENGKAASVARRVVSEAGEHGLLLLAREAEEWLKSLPAEN